jgi:anaerobic ribonucleoside-triphosphate reductase activating protein
LDLLIDGEYIDSLNDGVGLRGSSNQRFLFLTDRLEPYREQLERGSRTFEMSITDEGIFTIGIPKHS